MFSAKLIALMLSLRALLIPCCPTNHEEKQAYWVKYYARMPKVLMESSALEYAGDGTFWTLRDSGGPSVLYRIAANGELLDSLPLNLPNKDWEELARDQQGNLYIGDFGNNLNKRKNLKIYKLNLSTQQLDTIKFHWPEQQEFPPAKQELNYDCEAFFWYDNMLHLFTKSRGDRLVRHYRIPDQEGDWSAELLESVFVKDLITAADISPDGKTVALLTYGKVYLFSVGLSGAMLQQPLGCLRIPWAGQSESILFINNSSLLIGNETAKLFYLQLGK